jgi:hypothetical protein
MFCFIIVEILNSALQISVLLFRTQSVYGYTIFVIYRFSLHGPASTYVLDRAQGARITRNERLKEVDTVTFSTEV